MNYQLEQIKSKKPQALEAFYFYIYYFKRIIFYIFILLISVFVLITCFINLLYLNFLQIHRSHTINLAQLKRYKKGADHLAVLENNIEVPVGKQYRHQLLDAIETGIKK